MSRPILSAFLALAVVAAFVTAALADPAPRQHCGAYTVAQFASMDLGKYLEVIDYAQGVGGITADHADKLRALAVEVRAVQDPEAWAAAKCSEKGAEATPWCQGMTRQSEEARCERT